MKTVKFTAMKDGERDNYVTDPATARTRTGASA